MVVRSASQSANPSCVRMRNREPERGPGGEGHRLVEEERGVHEVGGIVGEVQLVVDVAVPGRRVAGVVGMVVDGDAGVGSGQVAPARRHARDLGSGLRLDDDASVEPVARPAERETRVAAPTLERGAVEDDVSLGGEFGGPVDRVVVDRRDATVLDDGDRSVGADPLDRVLVAVALGAVVVHLLPEVVAVDELHREPQAALPWMVGSHRPAQDPSSRRGHRMEMGFRGRGIVGPDHHSTVADVAGRL